jgi:hypothetical protein
VPYYYAPISITVKEPRAGAADVAPPLVGEVPVLKYAV